MTDHLTKKPLQQFGIATGTNLPTTGFVRLSSIIGPHGPIPVGKSTWWEGVNSGRFPKPVKIGPRITAWRVEDIRALIDELSAVTA